MGLIEFISVAVIFFLLGVLARGHSDAHGVDCQCKQCLRGAESDPTIDNLIESERAKIGNKVDVRI